MIADQVRANLGIVRGGRENPFFFKILYYFYRILNENRNHL